MSAMCARPDGTQRPLSHGYIRFAGSSIPRMDRFLHTHLVRAMVLEAPGRALRAVELPDPAPGPGELLLRVLACGVCRTDLHIVDGELTKPKLPLVPGHQI